MARTSDPHAATVKAWKTRQRRPDESEGLGTWTPEGKWIPNGSEAARDWGKGKGVLPGDVPIPFPVWTAEERALDPVLGKDWWVGNRPINKQEPIAGAKEADGSPKMVNVSDLIATQRVVTEANITKNIARANAGGGAWPRLPSIVVMGGKSYIYDGHHRATAAKVMGETQVLARVFELPVPAVMLTRARV